MDNEMIERVAKAINDDWLTNDTKNIDDFFKNLSIAAIKAMREPTEAMISAAYDIDTGDIERDIWHTMIDSITNAV